MGAIVNAEKSLGNCYSGVFGAAELDSGIRITRECTGADLWGCAGGELGEEWQRA